MSDKENTIRKCKNIRDRLFDREQLPSSIFNREVLKLLSPESTVLDIGCGREASFLRSLSSCVKKAYGIDVEISGAAISNENIEIMHGNAEAIPLPDRSVDVITMINVAEHLRDPERVFLECKRALKAGGSLILMAPSKFYPPVFFGRAVPPRIRQWANSVITGTKCEDTFPAYYRANSGRALRRLASSAGLSVLSIRHLSGHPAYFMFSTFFYRCAVAAERCILWREAFSRFRPKILCLLRSPGATDSPRVGDEKSSRPNS